MAAQDLQITLTGKDVSASDALRSLARAANTAARSAGDSLDQMNRRVESSSQNSLRSVTSGFGSGLASWAQSGLAGILGGVAASVTSTVTNVVADAGQAIMSQLKTSVIDYNSQLEQATIGFTTMLGSGKKAQTFLAELQAFAKKTPFGFGDLTNYSQQMIAYGIKSKEVIPYLTALGDAAAGAGKSSGDLGNAVLAFEQIAARGKVDLGDLNQMTQNGVPALAILANSYGITKGALLKLISEGKVMADDALPKLIKGIEKGTKTTAAFGGMMNKQSGTFAGAMSNIQDAMDQTLSSSLKPFYTQIEKGAIAVQKFASSKSFQKWASDTGKTMSGWMRQVGGGLKEVFSDSKTKKSMDSFGKSASKAFKGIGPALKDAMPDLVSFGKQIMPAMADAAKNVAKDMPKITKAIDGISASIKQAGPGTGDFIRWLGSLPGAAADFINGFRDAGRAVDDWHAQVAQNVHDVGKIFSDVVTYVGSVGKYMVDGFVNGITGAWGTVTSTIQTLINGIPLAVRKLLGIASPSKVFQQIGSYVGQGLTKGLLGSTDQIQAAATKMADTVKASFKAGNISKSVEGFALANIKSGSSYLTKLAEQRQTVKDRIASLRSDRTGVHDDVKAATIGAGDITGYAAPGDAVQGLAALVSKTKTFTSDLKALVKKGVSGSLLAQLVDGWQSDPDTALTTAQGLLSNPGDLKQILTLQKQLSAAGASLGAYAGGAEYNTQINNAKGKEKVLNWRMQIGASEVARVVSHDLHVHVNLSGTYAGTKESLAKSIAQLLRDEVKKGTIPKDWAKG